MSKDVLLSAVCHLITLSIGLSLVIDLTRILVLQYAQMSRSAERVHFERHVARGDQKKCALCV